MRRATTTTSTSQQKLSTHLVPVSSSVFLLRQPRPSLSLIMEELEEFTDTDTSIISYSRDLVTLIFCKSAVYVHPTPRSRDNIPGFLSLSRRPSPTSRDPSASDLLLSWIPVTYLGKELDQYTTIEQDGSANVRVKAPPSHTSDYAFSLPLNEVANLLVKPPRTGWSWGSLVVITTAGVSYPALFFHDDECVSTIAERKARSSSFDPFGESGHGFWGWDSLLTVLRALTNIKKSETSSGTYILNPSLPPIIPMARNGGPSLQWKILERFSRITRLGRSTADHILDSEAGQEILGKLPPVSTFFGYVTKPFIDSLAISSNGGISTGAKPSQGV